MSSSRMGSCRFSHISRNKDLGGTVAISLTPNTCAGNGILDQIATELCAQRAVPRCTSLWATVVPVACWRCKLQVALSSKPNQAAIYYF